MAKPITNPTIPSRVCLEGLRPPVCQETQPFTVASQSRERRGREGLSTCVERRALVCSAVSEASGTTSLPQVAFMRRHQNPLQRPHP